MESDPEVTPLGVMDLAGVGIVAVAAVVANAIYHAIGKRVRSLPVTIDKLLTAWKSSHQIGEHHEAL